MCFFAGNPKSVKPTSKTGFGNRKFRFFGGDPSRRRKSEAMFTVEILIRLFASGPKSYLESMLATHPLELGKCFLGPKKVTRLEGGNLRFPETHLLQF